MVTSHKSKTEEKKGSDNTEFELERTLTTQTALKLSVLNTFNHNYKPRKHTINTQLPVSRGPLIAWKIKI